MTVHNVRRALEVLLRDQDQLNKRVDNLQITATEFPKFVELAAKAVKTSPSR